MLGRNRVVIAASVVAAGLLSASVGGVASAFAAPGGDPNAAAPAATTAPTTGPAGAPAGGESMRVIVAEVAGMVQVRDNETAPWRKAAPGMELGEAAEFRTGPRSSVTCRIPPDQTFVIDRLGVMKVAEAVRNGNRVRTDLIMKYGRTQYAIEAAGAQHESTIRSPSSTLAVRGTVVSLYDQPPFTPEARSFTGRAVFQTAKREIALGAPGRGARLRANQATPAESALAEAVVDPAYAPARTNSEASFIAVEQSRGGIVNFDRRLNITTVRNSPPLGDADLLNNLPGRLNFVLRWPGNADLDLVVSTQVVPLQNATPTTPPAPDDPDFNTLLVAGLGNFQPGNFLFPGFGLDQNAIGGKIDFNHRGGPSGGQEIAYWGQNVPTGVYGLQTLHASGPATTFKWNAILEGKDLNIIAAKLDENGNTVPLRDPITGKIQRTPEGDIIPDIEINPGLERTSVPNSLVVGIVIVPDLFAAPPPTAAVTSRRMASMVGPTKDTMHKLAQAATPGPPINAQQAQDLREEARAARAADRQFKADAAKARADAAKAARAERRAGK